MTDDLLPADGELLMGCWDCSACDCRGIAGDLYQCAACGSPRPEDVAFYLPDDAPVISDADGIEAAEAGVDWHCARCGSGMPATDGHCVSCGASVAESVHRQREIEYEPGQTPRSAADLQPTTENDSGPLGDAAAGANPSLLAGARPASRKVALRVGGALTLAFLIFAAVHSRRLAAHQAQVTRQQQAVTRARDALQTAGQQLETARLALSRARAELSRATQQHATARRDALAVRRRFQAYQQAAAVLIIGHRWRTELKLEQCVAREGQGWSHPRGAFDIRSEQREHHRVRVLDRVETRYRTESYRSQDGHRTERYTERVRAGSKRVRNGYTTTSLGNGRFKRTPRYRTVPVYKTVSRTRRVPRYVQKTRQVPYQQKIYRQDPVFQPWYRYRTKVWQPAGSLSRSGQDRKPLDPEGSPAATPAPELGARRIASRTRTRWLLFRPRGATGGSQELRVRGVRWRAFAAGSTGLLLRFHAALGLADQLINAAEQQSGVATLRPQLDGAEARIARLATGLAARQERTPPLEAPVAAARSRLPALEAALARETEVLEALIARRP